MFDKNRKKRYLIPASVCIFLMAGIVYYYFFSNASLSNEKRYVYVDTDDTVDSVFNKLTTQIKPHSLSAFKTLTRHSSYAQHIRTGRYLIKPGSGAFSLFRAMKNGLQAPVNLTIPSVRTPERLSAELAKRLMIDSTTLISTLKDPKTCQQYGVDTATVICLFIPNTYDVYWNTTPIKLLERMKKEYDKYWNDDRKARAKALNLTPNEVMTLASIVDEETANNTEKPMVAGMYYNRLMLRSAEYPQGMPLQADPTIKFAWKKFELKRIYNNLLFIDNPYNTYRYPGLPPGPIRIPTLEGIEAVLHKANHDYLYMCANADFNGTHRFAKTYSEHLTNAAAYVKALNQRGIK